MQCTSPIRVHGLLVPCNHCISCRISYSREWAVRLMNEFETSFNRGCFITLTYDNEHLPSDNGLHKEHLQKFFKRLRKRLGEHKIKYYACGEYGDKEQIYYSPESVKPHGRPHYHAIIFNLSVMDCSILLPDVWTDGFFTIKPVFYESCKYVAGYVMKKYNGDFAKEIYGIASPPFRLSSLGLGKSYALEHREQIIANLGVKQGGLNKGFPKYYQSLFEREDLQDNEWYQKKLKGMKWLTHNEAFDIKSKMNSYNAFSFRNDIANSAIERDESEKEAYHNWIQSNNPDEFDTWSKEKYDKTRFESWQNQIRKLRDLTLKAKCSLHEQSKRKL